MGILENTIGAMIGHGSGGGSDRPHGGSPYAPIATALIAMLAGKAMTGGFGDLGGLLGGHKNAPAQPTPHSAPTLDPQQSGAGGLLAGLGGLVSHFQQQGHGDAVNSWVGPGQNKAMGEDELRHTLGPDTIRDLAQKTGIPESEIASRLSRELPEVVDKLTPNGRLPTRDEASAWS